MGKGAVIINDAISVFEKVKVKLAKGIEVSNMEILNLKEGIERAEEVIRNNTSSITVISSNITKAQNITKNIDKILG